MTERLYGNSPQCGKSAMGDLIKDINRLTEKGIKNFLIDEITLLDDFINSASALSDIYCQQGQKIILSGTDSLGFDFDCFWSNTTSLVILLTLHSEH